jgi:hypothetical protein
MSKVECFGVDYERRDLGKLLERLAKEYQTRNVLEIPVSDEKAMPSIYPLAFGMAGCD